ncbi:hypothetical protein RSAG8_06633, partial [Rhizoctonia solani AG-8 WAC10335]
MMIMTLRRDLRKQESRSREFASTCTVTNWCAIVKSAGPIILCKPYGPSRTIEGDMESTQTHWFSHPPQQTIPCTAKTTFQWLLMPHSLSLYLGH